MKDSGKSYKVLKSVYSFLLFFLLCSFLITCCMVLFLQIMSRTMNLHLSAENVEFAAKCTFGNVVFLSFMLSVFDFVRKKITVDKPVKKIVDAAEKMMRGDFSVRIKTRRNININDGFNDISLCLNKVAEELQGVETLRTDFISNVSHELKTPLTVIQNYGTILQAPDLTENERVEYAKEITLASRRLSSLVTNILRLNKLENQQIAPVFKEYNLSEQLCESLLSFEEVWEKKQLNIETAIDDELIIKSDAEMMSIVWNNLISNAIKFTETGGTVAVKTKKDGNHIIVTVSDTGCGITKTIGKHIFDKFYQGDTSHATEGNGLGLALVKRVIDITGNDIYVESEPGEGTTFTVKILN